MHSDARLAALLLLLGVRPTGGPHIITVPHLSKPLEEPAQGF
jgi:hypothetical protein